MLPPPSPPGLPPLAALDLWLPADVAWAASEAVAGVVVLVEAAGVLIQKLIREIKTRIS